MAIILEKGPAGLTMRHLAESMNMTAGALYRYFPTKGQIIGGLGNRSLNQYAQCIVKGVDRANHKHGQSESKAKAIHRIMVIHQEYINLSIRSFGNYRILNMIMVHPERFMTSEDDYKQFMGNAVKLLSFTGTQFESASHVNALSQGDGFERALMLVSLMNGALQLIKFGEELPDLFDNPSIRQKALENMLMGMGASQDSLDEAKKLFQ